MFSGGKPAWWDGVVDRLNAVRPEDLPPTPWTLLSSPPQQIGLSTFFGGAFVKVIDNELFLAALKRDVAQGWNGPRMKHGALEKDLRALKAVLATRPAARDRRPAQR